MRGRSADARRGIPRRRSLAAAGGSAVKRGKADWACFVSHPRACPHHGDTAPRRLHLPAHVLLAIHTPRLSPTATGPVRPPPPPARHVTRHAVAAHDSTVLGYGLTHTHPCAVVPSTSIGDETLHGVPLCLRSAVCVRGSCQGSGAAGERAPAGNAVNDIRANQSPVAGRQAGGHT
jgi:hypothetical protein